MRSLMLTGLVMSALLLVGCAGSGGGAPSRGSGGGAPEPAVNGSGGAMGPAPAIGAAPYEGDFQVIFFQANGAQTMILVNEGHKARGTDAGRRRLALNIPGGGYKVLEERSMKALLKSLEERQYSQLSTPFRRGDERCDVLRVCHAPDHHGPADLFVDGGEAAFVDVCEHEGCTFSGQSAATRHPLARPPRHSRGASQPASHANQLG